MRCVWLGCFMQVLDVILLVYCDHTTGEFKELNTYFPQIGIHL